MLKLLSFVDLVQLFFANQLVVFAASPKVAPFDQNQLSEFIDVISWRQYFNNVGDGK